MYCTCSTCISMYVYIYIYKRHSYIYIYIYMCILYRCCLYCGYSMALAIFNHIQPYSTIWSPLWNVKTQWNSSWNTISDAWIPFKNHISLKSHEHPMNIPSTSHEFPMNFLRPAGQLPSGKHVHNYGKIHHFWWENSLFPWPCSIAM